jgi:hypothetical protein
VLEAPAFVAGLDDVAVMREAVEQRGRHLGIAKDGWPPRRPGWPRALPFHALARCRHQNRQARSLRSADPSDARRRLMQTKPVL